MSIDYITVEEAAQLLNRRPETVLLMIRCGELPVAAGIGVHGYAVWRAEVERRAADRTMRSGRRTPSPREGQAGR